EAVQVRPPILMRAQQTPISAQLFQQELGVLAGNLEIVGALQVARRLSETAQHQPVPGSQYLLVAPRFDTLLARPEELFAALLQDILYPFSGQLSLFRYPFHIPCHM